MNFSERDVIRAKCIDFRFFARYFFKKIEGHKYRMPEHIEQIIDALTEVVEGKATRLIINISPRYGKTYIAVKLFIAYIIAWNPRAKFIHLSSSDALALANSSETKDIINSQEFQELFNVILRNDSKSKKSWRTAQGGGVYATSTGGQVTGFGAGSFEVEKYENFLDSLLNFGGAILVDDPNKPDDVASELKRGRINNRFDSTVSNRTNNARTPIIVIQQRLHPLDLSGYLLKRDEDEEWKKLVFPCIKEDGTALWEEKESLQELLKQKRLNESVFQAQKMQNPTEEFGKAFPLSHLKRFSGETRYKSRIVMIDPADRGTDFFALAVQDLYFNQDHEGNYFDVEVYLNEVLFTQDGHEKTMPLTQAMMQRLKPDHIVCEINSLSSVIVNSFSQLSPNFYPVTTRTNKIAKINNGIGYIKYYYHFREDYIPNSDYCKFMNNLTDYEKSGQSKHDDAPDVLTMGYLAIQDIFPNIFG